MLAETSEEIKILLVEDEPRWIKIFRDEIIESNQSLELSGVATKSSEALELIKSNPTINLVVMDYEFDQNDLWGAELASLILEVNPTIKIVFWSIHISYGNRREAKEIGASGYIEKNVTNIGPIVAAFISIIESKNKIWEEVLKEDSEYKFDDFKELSPKDIQIMKQLADGSTPKEIAHKSLEEDLIEEGKYEEIIKEYGSFDKYCNSVPPMREETFKPPKGYTNGIFETWKKRMGVAPSNKNENRNSQSNSTKIPQTRLATRRNKIDNQIRTIKIKLHKQRNNGNPPTHDDLIRFPIAIIAAFYFKKKEREYSIEVAMMSQFLELRLKKISIKKISELYNSNDISEVKNILLEIRQTREKLPLEQIARKYLISTPQLNEFIDSTIFLGENEA